MQRSPKNWATTIEYDLMFLYCTMQLPNLPKDTDSCRCINIRMCQNVHLQYQDHFAFQLQLHPKNGAMWVPQHGMALQYLTEDVNICHKKILET